MRLETLALKWAITDKFRDYLLGGLFTVYTDNIPLTYFHKKAKLSAVDQKWAAALSPFDFSKHLRNIQRYTPITVYQTAPFQTRKILIDLVISW